MSFEIQNENAVCYNEIIRKDVREGKSRMSTRNHEVTKKQLLLDAQGNIAEPGWSRRQLQQYSRTQIRAPKFRIKEGTIIL